MADQTKSPEVQVYDNVQEKDFGDLTTKDYYNRPEVPHDPVIKKQLKRKIVKNVIVLCFVFLFHYTAVQGLGALQSSLHRVDGMGPITISIQYASGVLTNFFLPKFMISTIRHKWAIPFGMSGYLIWMAANGYAVWGTMVTASFLLGICYGTFLTASSSYLSKCSQKYAEVSGEDMEVVTSRFFGMWTGSVQFAGIVGSIVSSTVLRTNIPMDNETLSNDQIGMYCGINDCPWNNVTNAYQEKPPSSTVWTLVGIYLGIDLLAILGLCIFLDNLPTYLEQDKQSAKKEIKASFIKTVMHTKNKIQILLIPMTIYYGLIKSFYDSDFNRSYLSCTMGIWMIGFVSLPYNIVSSVFCFVGGVAIKYIGRIPIFSMILCVHLAYFLTLFLWNINKDQDYVLYTLTGVYGMSEGLFTSQLMAIYGILFPHNTEAGYAHCQLWQAVASTVAFGYSHALCTDIKIYIMLSFLGLSLICYAIMESFKRKEAKEKKIDENTEQEKPEKDPEALSEKDSPKANDNNAGVDNMAYTTDNSCDKSEKIEFNNEEKCHENGNQADTTTINENQSMDNYVKEETYF